VGLTIFHRIFLTLSLNVGSIMWNSVSLTHCCQQYYEFEQCYEPLTRGKLKEYPHFMCFHTIIISNLLQSICASLQMLSKWWNHASPCWVEYIAISAATQPINAVAFPPSLNSHHKHASTPPSHHCFNDANTYIHLKTNILDFSYCTSPSNNYGRTPGGGLFINDVHAWVTTNLNPFYTRSWTSSL
jgi:hypothetical protein